MDTTMETLEIGQWNLIRIVSAVCIYKFVSARFYQLTYYSNVDYIAWQNIPWLSNIIIQFHLWFNDNIPRTNKTTFRYSDTKLIHTLLPMNLL